ncbi:MAG: hypothetical protein LBQ10_12150 [Desulfovibrio sp.]|jgi:hypothetical protein|nr:hypothetical protein [Desulfovibrio sp.]
MNVEQRGRAAIAKKLADRKSFMQSTGMPILRQAIETSQTVWVTTDEHGSRLIKPHRIAENELHCDVLLVTNVSDSAHRNAVMNIDEIYRVSFKKETLG